MENGLCVDCCGYGIPYGEQIHYLTYLQRKFKEPLIEKIIELMEMELPPTDPKFYEIEEQFGLLPHNCLITIIWFFLVSRFPKERKAAIERAITKMEELP